jgi:hypothetical protein
MAGGITQDEFSAELRAAKRDLLVDRPTGAHRRARDLSPEARVISALYDLASAVGQSLPELQHVLADESAGAGGWGPDATTVPVLRNATARLEDAMAALRGTGYDPK